MIKHAKSQPRVWQITEENLWYQHTAFLIVIIYFIFSEESLSSLILWTFFISFFFFFHNFMHVHVCIPGAWVDFPRRQSFSWHQWVLWDFTKLFQRLKQLKPKHHLFWTILTMFLTPALGNMWSNSYDLKKNLIFSYKASESKLELAIKRSRSTQAHNLNNLCSTQVSNATYEVSRP